jgi:flagellar basal body-associated protein FliL
MRNRLIILLILPIALFLWIIGWIMSWAGTSKEHHTKKTKANIPQDDSITIIPIMPEEIEQLED